MSTSGEQNKREHFSLNMEGINWERVGSMVTFVLLLCYILVIPLKFQIGWLSVRIQLLLFLSIVARVIASIHTVSLTRTQIVVFIVLGLTVCATILGQVVAVPGQNLQTVPQVTRFIVLALACVVELDSSERIHKALIAVTVSATVVAVLSLVNVFVQLPFAYTSASRTLGPFSFSTPRSLGIWMSFGSYGIIAVIGASYAGLCALRPTVFSRNVSVVPGRVLYVTSLGLILLSVYVGQSRSTILAFASLGVCALITLGFHPNRKLRSDNFRVYQIILVAGTLAVILQLPTILRSFIGTNVGSITIRLDQYRFSLLLMSERPILGWGWNYFGSAFGTGYTVHNLWLVLGVSLGIPIFLLWIYLFYRLGISLLRQALSDNGDTQIFGFLGIVMLLGVVIEVGSYPGFTSATALFISLMTAVVGLGTDEYCVQTAV